MDNGMNTQINRSENVWKTKDFPLAESQKMRVNCAFSVNSPRVFSVENATFFAVIVCGIIYYQHNSPDYFLMHLDNKDVYIMGDFNMDLLNCESSQISQDYLLSLRSCYLIPTEDKPSCVHRTSATLIDNIFVNNPDQLVASKR